MFVELADQFSLSSVLSIQDSLAHVVSLEKTPSLLDPGRQLKSSSSSSTS